MSCAQWKRAGVVVFAPVWVPAMFAVVGIYLLVGMGPVLLFNYVRTGEFFDGLLAPRRVKGPYE